jgi:hypothetical protein
LLRVLEIWLEEIGLKEMMRQELLDCDLDDGWWLEEIGL